MWHDRGVRTDKVLKGHFLVEVTCGVSEWVRAGQREKGGHSRQKEQRACDLGLRVDSSKWKEVMLERRSGIWEEPLFWGWGPWPVGMVPALIPLGRVPGLCAVGLGLGGQAGGGGGGPSGLSRPCGAWDCVNPRPLALFPWAEQIMGLEPVRASWMKQACDNT